MTLCVVGGGSAYTPGLLAALIDQHAHLPLRTIRLYDIHPRHVEIVARLGNRMADAAEVELSIEATDTLADAVQNADVVLNASRPGGFECRRIDETLPLELGIPGQETVGPGGFFFALRSVPAAIEVAAAIEARAPGAVLLNYTNPTNIVTQALAAGGVAVIGLCDQADEDMLTLRRALNRQDGPLHFDCVGLNHATWYSSIAFGSEPLEHVRAEVETPADLDPEHRLRFRISREMAEQRPGHWPNSYLPYYERPDSFVRLARDSRPRSDAIVEALDGYYRHFAEESDKAKPQLRAHRGSSGHADLAVRTMRALTSQQHDMLVLNVRNRGITTDMDDDTVVEARVGVSATGVRRLPAPDFPEGRRALIDQLEEYQFRTVAAAISGSGHQAIAALRSNPLVANRWVAESLFERARELYGPMLGGFA